MSENALLLAAIEDNIAWCSTICASHHSAERNSKSAWSNLAPSPPFYPNIITRRRNSQAEIAGLVKNIRQRGMPRAWAVKDSFHDLDLPDLGFSPVVEGQWFGVERAAHWGRPEHDWEIVRHPQDLSLWEAAWDESAHRRIFKDVLLSDARIRFWMLRHDDEVVAGFISSSSGVVTSLSNWFSKLAESVFDLGITHPIAETALGGSIVFWASGNDPAFSNTGFRPLGALRVWMTEPASI
jgi:hypothetical protein